MWQDLQLDGERYLIEHLLPGKQYVLFINAEGHGTELVGPWKSKLGGTRWDVVLRAPRILEIQVLRPDGLPASHAQVSLGYSGTVQTPKFYGQRYADKDGLLLYEDLIPGPYFTSAFHKGASARNDRFEIRADRLVTRIVLELKKH